MVHFRELAMGAGSNMALPTSGTFMKTCLADPELNIREYDCFEAPAGMNLDLTCTGGDKESDEEVAASYAGDDQEEDDFFN